ncbi:MAG: hypothetical protein ACNFW9_00160 [Candidatus Kerfeldbacteria bacterium]
MEFLFSKIKKIKIKYIYYTFVIVVIAVIGIEKVNAQWEIPTNLPPDSNIFVPLNVGPYKQAKEGGLLLDPLFNPYGAEPDIDYSLEVRGSQDAYINNFEIIPGGKLIVDTDTLYVDGEFDQVGIGTSTFELSSTLEVHGGSVNIGQEGVGNGVAGIGLTVNSNTERELIIADSNSNTDPTVFGQGIIDSNGNGVYGLNVANGVGISAISNDASAVVGTVSSAYDPTEPIVVAGIYGNATGLGAWAGYFQQRLFGTGEIVANKFLPNRLQSSEVPYTTGWKKSDITDSELIDVNYMTFDRQYIWALGGYWSSINPEHVLIIDPDNMGVVDKIILSNNDHYLVDIIDGGGYIWVAHNYNYGSNHQAAVTRIDPADVHNFQTTYIYPDAGSSGNNDSESVKLLYDDETLDGPYIWVLNKLNYDPVHSITQLDMDGNVVVTFSISDLANGGNKCSRYNNYLYSDTDHCDDRLDNDDDGIIDNGLCEYNALTTPIVTDSATCGIAGGTWVEACTDRIFDNQIDCEAGSAVWAETCSNSSCSDSDECTLCGGAGVWDSVGEVCPADLNCNTQVTCEGTVTCDGIWTAGDDQCLADTPLGVCAPTISLTTWGECINAGETWTWNTASGPANIDERIVDAYIGVPSGLTLDGDGNVWVTFRGSPDWDYRDIFSGEGYAKFNASDPELAVDQYVYCSGPETSPSGIAYDELNDQMWITYDPSTMHDNRGLSKVDVSNGQVTGFISDNFGAQIKYFMGSPSGPSIWINGGGSIIKIDPDTNVVENTRYIYGHDFDFDERDPANPQILRTTGDNAVILKHTMEDPYTTSTNVILGASSEKLLFDGTNIWSSNYGTNTLTKYSAQGAEKLGVYDVGVSTDQMISDGQAIWVPFEEYWTTKYKRIDILNGNVDEYELVPDLGNTHHTLDTVFDGKNIWQSVFSEDRESMIIKVDLSSCDLATKLCSVGSVFNYPDTLDGPEKLIFDGEFIWAFNHHEPKVYKFSTDPITIEAEITVSDILSAPYVDHHYSRMNAVEFDGTDIWVGAYYTDSDGNSIYKFNPEGINNDGDHGICSNDSSISCNLTSDCGGNACNVVINGKYSVLNMPGECSVSEDSCIMDSDCGGSETCDGMWTGVTSLTFDGINMWATHEGFGDHDSTGDECKDKLDNDGNGQCDYDGAVGYPGCSGKPDPGCSDPDTDTLEITGRNSRYEGSNKVLTRIVVATGEIVESVSINPIKYSSTYVYDAAFDGQNIWLGGSGFNGNTLVQFYSGSGFNDTDYINNLILRNNIPLLSQYRQAGSFAMAGSMNIGNKLIVKGDLVVQNNTWGGAADNVKDFGVGCDDGEFMKGIGFTNAGVYTSEVDSEKAHDVALDSTYMYAVGWNYDAVKSWRIEKRLKATGELDTNFGYDCSSGSCNFTGDGVIIGYSSSDMAQAISIDSTYMYVVGSRASSNWRIEKRLLSTGELDSGFGAGGVIEGNVVTDDARGISIDSTYMYVVGDTDGGDWRIEKRLLSTGALDTSFGYDCSSAPCNFTGDGIITGDSDSLYARDIEIDSDFMYVVGWDDDTDNYLRIEKRLLSTGELDASFGSGGVINGTITENLGYSIILDSTYMYISEYFPATGLRIEKRLLSTGALCTEAECGQEFGIGGAIITSSYPGHDIAVDSMYMYVSMSLNNNWHIEKRLLSTGALDTSFGYDCSSGVCAFTGDGIISGFTESDRAYGIKIDSTYMYVVGDDDIGYDWRIEKRLLTTGAVAAEIDGAVPTGIYTSDTTSAQAFDIAVDSTYMYTVGYNDGDDWRIEKRLISNGILDSGFGTSGVVTGAASSSFAYAIEIDSIYMYVSGHDGSNNWRIEKRLLSTGELDASFGYDCSSGVCAFTGNGIISGFAESNRAYGIDIDSTYMYVVGDTDGDDWRIEKRLLSTGELDASFDTDGVVAGDAASYQAWDIEIDTNSMYVIGWDDDATNYLRIEKRLLSTGALDTTFDTDGVVNGTIEGNYFNNISIDSNYMYLAGTLQLPSEHLRIEKRLLSTGALCTAAECGQEFGTNGVETEAVDRYYSTTDIAVDPTYMYVAFNYGAVGSTHWRIEKRLLSDGTLDPGFGYDCSTNACYFTGNGVVIGSTYSQVPYAIQIDSTYMYVVGEDDIVPANHNWRIEKRLLSTGGVAVGESQTLMCRPL